MEVVRIATAAGRNARPAGGKAAILLVAVSCIFGKHFGVRLDASKSSAKTQSTM